MEHGNDVGEESKSPPTQSLDDTLFSANLEQNVEEQPSREGTPPPLPPRPQQQQQLTSQRPNLNSPGSLRTPKSAERPRYHSRATTAISLAASETPRAGNHSPNSKAIETNKAAGSRRTSLLHVGGFFGGRKRDVSDSASVRSLVSYAPSIKAEDRDVHSLLGRGFGASDEAAWQNSSMDDANEVNDTEALQFQTGFASEFVELDELKANGSNEEALALAWSLKLKHFLILSSSGKPIWSRHGDDQLISGTIGVVQTIISAYQGSEDVLKSFTAGNARFVILSKGHLHLLAVSRLGENDIQLRNQLEALYMQILSTLTLPTMERIFQNRPSTDLRRPLQGTEKLLSALADGFTRGSPSTLLSALECLRIRKAHRAAINNTFVKVRAPALLYGLIVAGGRLVSVLRPKKHSLHPNDLHLIFNMLFETGAVRAGGDESWIPLCLPGFNSSGYVFMYVNYIRSDPDASTNDTSNDIAIVLLSAHRDSLDSLKEMRQNLLSTLTSTNLLPQIHTALTTPRPTCSEILPGTILRHFLYKSRANVQFTRPSASSSSFTAREPTSDDHDYDTPLKSRRLMTIYAQMHAAVHEKTTGIKVYHRSSRDFVAVAWVTPTFEFYGVAPGGSGRNAVVASAARVVKWAEREADRLFIIGGAVF